MIRLNQAADQTSETAKAMVCPLQRDVEQLKRDVGEIWEILKQPKRHVLREVDEIQQASHTYTGAFIVSYNNKCFTYAAMFCGCSSKSNNYNALTCLLAHRTIMDMALFTKLHYNKISYVILFFISMYLAISR